VKFLPRFSPIDSSTWGEDESAPDCMCPDRFIAKGRAVSYCPRHGSKPDYSLVTGDVEAAKRWREENGVPTA
jgi:hypothetical protein